MWRRVDMPPDDGAPYTCTESVKAPPPHFVEKCGRPAAVAFVDDESGRRRYICDECLADD